MARIDDLVLVSARYPSIRHSLVHGELSVENCVVIVSSNNPIVKPTKRLVCNPCVLASFKQTRRGVYLRTKSPDLS